MLVPATECGLAAALMTAWLSALAEPRGETDGIINAWTGSLAIGVLGAVFLLFALANPEVIAASFAQF